MEVPDLKDQENFNSFANKLADVGKELENQDHEYFFVLRNPHEKTYKFFAYAGKSISEKEKAKRFSKFSLQLIHVLNGWLKYSYLLIPGVYSTINGYFSKTDRWQKEGGIVQLKNDINHSPKGIISKGIFMLLFCLIGAISSLIYFPLPLKIFALAPFVIIINNVIKNFGKFKTWFKYKDKILKDLNNGNDNA